MSKRDGSGFAAAVVVVLFGLALAGALCAPRARAEYKPGSGGGVATRTAVTGTATLSGAGNILADVTTIGASYDITLPAATSGQSIDLVDSSGGVGAQTYLVGIVPGGAETFAVPAGGTAARLYFAEPGASVRLMGVTGTGWVVTGGRRWGVDPRGVTGVYLWVDARRGLTYASGTSRNVSTWADQSGNGRNFTQATSAQQPVATNLTGGPALHFAFAKSTTMATANASLASGAISILVLAAQRAPETAAFQPIIIWAPAALSGVGFYVNMTTLNDWINFDLVGYAAGSNSGVAPRHIGYLANTSNEAPQSNTGGMPRVYSLVLGAGAARLSVDGVRVTQRVTSVGAAAAITNQPINIGFDTGTSYFDGAMSTVMMFNAALSTADESVLVTDIARQWRAR